MDADLLDSSQAVDLEDPAMLAAPLARRLAHEHCWRDPASGETCAWYHGPRLAFRAVGLDVGKGPRDQAAMAGEALQRLAPDHRRVLLAGSADYAFAAVLHAFYRAARAPLSLTVVDRCETPLRLVEWHARRVGLDVSTVRADLSELDDLGPFDLIGADAVLGHFAPPARDPVVANWRTLLRPGGRVLALVPIRATDLDESEWSRRSEALFARARRAMDEGRATGYDSAELLAALATFRARNRTHPIRSVDEIERLFTRNGFALERVDHHVVARERPQSASNDYYVMVARRD